LTPPLAFTHAKYAASILEMSVKSVPGCLVLIAPSTIGVPVAATPGLDPHDDVSEVPLELAELLEVELADADVVPLAAALLEALLVLLLLLPQPVIAMTPAIAARARPSRKRIETSSV